MSESDEELSHLQAFYKGRELEAKDELEEALRYYRLSIEKNPTFIKGLFQMAKVYYRMGNKIEAMDIALKIIDLEPKWKKQVLPFLGEEPAKPKEKFDTEGVFEVFRKEGGEFTSIRASSREKSKRKPKLRTLHSLSKEDKDILAKQATTWEDFAQQGLIYFIQGNRRKGTLALQEAYERNPVNLAVLSFLLVSYLDDLPKNPFPLLSFHDKIITPEDTKKISHWKDSIFLLVDIVKGNMSDLPTHLTWIPQRHMGVGIIGTAVFSAYPYQPSVNLVKLARKINSGRLGVLDSRSKLILNTAQIFENAGMTRKDAISKTKQCIVEAVAKTGAL